MERADVEIKLVELGWSNCDAIFKFDSSIITSWTKDGEFICVGPSYLAKTNDKEDKPPMAYHYGDPSANLPDLCRYLKDVPTKF